MKFSLGSFVLKDPKENFMFFLLRTGLGWFGRKSMKFSLGSFVLKDPKENFMFFLLGKGLGWFGRKKHEILLRIFRFEKS